MIRANLDLFDFLIVGFFLMLFIVWPHFFAKKSPNSDSDFLLMGRTLCLPLFVATLTSTWYGGILGVTQIAFLQGIYGFFTQGLFWYFSYFAFALFLAKKVRRAQVLSLPELIGQKFGPKSRKLAAIILFFHSLPLTYAISVGLLIELTFELSFFWSIFIGVGMVAIYTGFGGFKGVVSTDCLQFVLMFVAVILVVCFCYYQHGGFDFLSLHLPKEHFLWRGEHQVSRALIWLFIACTSTFIHPAFYQRCLAAKSDNVAIFGIILAMLMWLIFDFCTSLGGMYARALFPKSDSATAYLILGTNILPHGLRGLFLVGVLATILSTLDSFMFVSGTSISYDLLKARADQRHHKLAIFASALLVIILGNLFSKDFEANWLLIEGAFSSALFAPLLAAVLLKRKLYDAQFLWPAIGALVVFFTTTYLNFLKLSVWPAFYCAHFTAMSLLVLALKAKPHSQSDVAFARSA